ncbi:cell division protein PerM, partial [Streptomyces daliensis]
MSQVTQRSPSLSPYARTARRPLPASGAWLFGGAVAACLGLGLLAVVVLLLWITSPYPDSGPGGALHVAADLWLLAHGARLVRAETLSGQSAPMALTPMLLAVPPAWLLYRTTLLALVEGEERGDGRGPRSVVGWVAGGYLLVAGAAVCYTATGPLRVDVLSAVLRLPLFVLGVTAVAGWLGGGRPALELPARLNRLRWLNWLHRVFARPLLRILTRRRVLTAVRGAGAAVAVLVGGGALLAGGVTVWHAGAAQRAFPQLTDSWSGYVAVLLAAVALVPNAAVWGAAYALGPGFTLGAGSAVDPLGGAVGYPQLPHFPLLAALPGEGGG